MLYSKFALSINGCKHAWAHHATLFHMIDHILQNLGKSKVFIIWWYMHFIYLSVRGIDKLLPVTKWHHELEIHPILLALCERNLSVINTFSSLEPVMQSFYIFFVISLTKLLNCWAFPDNKVHGAIIGPTLALLAPGGPHIGPMNLAIRVVWLEMAWCSLDINIMTWQTSHDIWELQGQRQGYVITQGKI